MKKLIEIKSGHTVEILYMPFYAKSSWAIQRFKKCKVLLNILGFIVAKANNKITFISRYTASRITCK